LELIISLYLGKKNHGKHEKGLYGGIDAFISIGIGKTFQLDKGEKTFQLFTGEFETRKHSFFPFSISIAKKEK